MITVDVMREEEVVEGTRILKDRISLQVGLSTNPVKS